MSLLFKCDRCGKIFTSDTIIGESIELREPFVIVPRHGDRSDHYPPKRLFNGAFDEGMMHLCNDCTKEFVEFFRPKSDPVRHRRRNR